MVEANEDVAGQRDRSPAYPNVPLEVALARLVEFEAHFKRSAARPEKIGEAWGVKAKGFADRVAAALRYFGLIEYQGAGKDRRIVVSDEGRKYLRAQQDEIKREVIRAAALRPKSIADFWNEWGADRPADAACLDELVLKSGFSEAGARKFLKVYDATISYAGLSASDKLPESREEAREDEGKGDHVSLPSPSSALPARGKVMLMEGERELTSGLLAKDARFRLIVNGTIGVKEIERLIKKLELDKEILAERDEAGATE